MSNKYGGKPDNLCVFLKIYINISNNSLLTEKHKKYVNTIYIYLLSDSIGYNSDWLDLNFCKILSC